VVSGLSRLEIKTFVGMHVVYLERGLNLNDPGGVGSPNFSSTIAVQVELGMFDIQTNTLSSRLFLGLSSVFTDVFPGRLCVALLSSCHFYSRQSRTDTDPWMQHDGVV
jgi:hypothetical protein